MEQSSLRLSLRALGADTELLERGLNAAKAIVAAGGYDLSTLLEAAAARAAWSPGDPELCSRLEEAAAIFSLAEMAAVAAIRATKSWPSDAQNPRLVLVKLSH